MKLKARERILLGGLVAALLFWLWSYHRSEAPGRRSFDRSVGVEDLAAVVAKKRRELRAAQRSIEKLNRWREMSLPPDESPEAEALNAQRLYHAWIADVARAASLTGIHVRPVGVAADDFYSAVRVELSGQASYDELLLLLDQFNLSDLLHRVRSLKVARRPGARLDVSLVVEGLVLEGAKSRRRLFQHSTLSENATRHSDHLRVRGGRFLQSPPFVARVGGELVRVVKQDPDGWLVERAQLGTTASGHLAGTAVEQFPWRQSQPQPAPMASVGCPFVRPDSEAERPGAETEILPRRSAHTYLVATIQQPEARQAWFYDRMGNRHYAVTLGSVLMVDQTAASVTEIDRQQVTVRLASHDYRIELGNNLTQLERVTEEVVQLLHPPARGRVGNSQASFRGGRTSCRLSQYPLPSLRSTLPK